MTIRAFLEKSLRQIKVLAAGEVADGDTIQDALASFNMLLDMWNAEGLLRPRGGLSTLGVSGTQLVQDSASSIDPSAIYGISYAPASTTDERPLQILTPEQFQVEKSQTEQTALYAEKIYFYKNTIGNLLCYLFPTPTGTGSLVFYKQERFTATNSNLSADFPVELVGYQAALMFNLAIFMAPEYGLAMDPNLMKLAEESKAQIMRSNFDPIEINSDINELVNNVYFDIYKGP